MDIAYLPCIFLGELEKGVPEIKPKASQMLGNYSTLSHVPSPHSIFLKATYDIFSSKIYYKKIRGVQMHLPVLSHLLVPFSLLST